MRAFLYLQAAQSHGDANPILRVDQALPSNRTSFMRLPSFHLVGRAAMFTSPGTWQHKEVFRNRGSICWIWHVCQGLQRTFGVGRSPP